MISEPITGWAFLVARGRQAGYQLLLAPEFIVTSRESALLMDEVGGEVPIQGPPVVTDITAPISGPLCVIYRTTRATRQDAGAADRPGEPLLDRAGRPLVLTYGFICRGARVIASDDQDLRIARTAAVATYRRFRAAEQAFLTETSQPYPVHSTVAPVEAAVPGPTASRPAASRPAGPAQPALAWPAASRSPAPWTSQILPDSQRAAPAWRRPAIVISLIAALALFGLASGAYVFTHGRQAQIRGPHVEVPNVVGEDQAVAVRQIQKANLIPKIELAASQRPAGIVLQTWPQAGDPVDSHTVVHVDVSRGSPPRQSQHARTDPTVRHAVRR